MPKRRELAVILFADMVGYTAMMQKDEAHALSSIHKFKEIVSSSISVHGGRLIQDLGDGCLLSFSTCTSALQCAIQMQVSLQEDPEVLVRVGLHLGEVMVDGENVYGDGVNIASRIESLAIPGSILISKHVRDQIKNKAQFSLSSMGLRRFKNVSESIEVFAVVDKGIVVPDPKQLEDYRPTGKKSIMPYLYVGLGLLLLAVGYLIRQSFKPSISEQYEIKPLNVSTWFEGLGSWSPEGDRYAYMSLKSGNGDLYVRNRHGGRAIQITRTPYDEFNARWSPDGDMIAFVSIRGGRCNIYTVPAAGGGERMLASTNIPGVEQSITTMFTLGAAPWSPDGKTLMYSAMNPDRSISIWRVEVASGERMKMTKTPAGNQDLMGSWSADGQRFVFARNHRLFLQSINSTEAESILKEDFHITLPQFSTKDSKIIFSLAKSGDQNIWAYDLQQGDLRKLTNFNRRAWGASIIPSGGLSVDEFSHNIDIISMNIFDRSIEQLTFYNGDNSYANFSPDGRQLVYQSDRSGNLEIWLRTLDEDATEINLSHHDAIDFKPAWSPDGSRIAFLSNRDETFQIWTMDNAGLNLRQVTHTPIQLGAYLIKAMHQVKWSPSGNEIGYLALGPEGPSLWLVDVQSGTQRVAISGVHSFAWYPESEIVIVGRLGSDKNQESQLVAWDLESGEEKILSRNIPLTELFIDRKGRWLGYTSAVGHFSYALHRLALTVEFGNDKFPSINGDPEILAEGAGKWHVHDGCFSPNDSTVIFSRDADQMNMFLLEPVSQ